MVLALAGGCTPPQPTPYQPLVAGSGGYEETRLQDDLYRVSFRGNRYTPEQDVIDLLYLRSAELTLEAGYDRFEIVEDYGTVQYHARPYAGGDYPRMLPGPHGRIFWGGSFGPSHYDPVYVAEPQYRLAMFVIRMHKDGEGGPGAYDAKQIAASLAAKKNPPPVAK